MSALENAKARRLELRAELARVEQFIRDYEGFDSGEFPARQVVKKTVIKGQNAEVLKQVIAVLKASPERLRTTEIVERIAATGFVIQAQNRFNYVGIVIHRNQDKIDRTKAGSRLRESVLREVAA
jgi:hypothetical protein